MRNKKKIKAIIIFLISIIILISSSIYIVKANNDRKLKVQIEEIIKEFDDIEIINMNSNEENVYNHLKENFNGNIANKNLNGAKDIITQLSNLKSSVEKRIKDEEDKKLEEEKIKEELEKKAVEKEKNEENDSTVLENNNNEITNSNNSTQTQNNNNPKIANTSVAKSSNQIISVVSTGGSTAELVLWQKDSNGNWYEYDSMFARLGENGMKNASEVYEMDLCTPTGVYSLTEAFGVAQNPGSKIPYRVLDGSEYWVDDESSSYYNTMQFGSANGRWNSAEHLIEHSDSYKYSLVIDYNRWPVIPGKSSAIFLHVDVGIPTWGCVAVELNKMKEILQWINPSENPQIMIALNYSTLYSY